MDCEIAIPWNPNGNIGAAYNRIMQRSEGWVAFFDHDILQVTPNWYRFITDAIERLGRGAGFITCRTNATACASQLCPDAPTSQDIVEHMRYAKGREAKYGDRITTIDIRQMPFPLSGFMILTHKGAWRAAGGFCDGLFGVDNDYHAKIVQAGYGAYVIEGYYVYHLYRNKQLWPNL